MKEVVLPGFAVMELMQGCDNRNEMRALQEKLRPYDVLWPRRDTYRDVLALFAKIRLSHNTGIIDTLIGMTAVEYHVPLHTFNEKHYRPIPGLETVQPYAQPLARGPPRSTCPLHVPRCRFRLERVAEADAGAPAREEV